MSKPNSPVCQWPALVTVAVQAVNVNVDVLKHLYGRAVENGSARRADLIASAVMSAGPNSDQAGSKYCSVSMAEGICCPWGSVDTSGRMKWLQPSGVSVCNECIIFCNLLSTCIAT